MTKNHENRSAGEGPDHELASRLAQSALPPAAALERNRERLYARADSEGLIDVAYERHASPLGTLLIAATSKGVVRIGLPTENEDSFLDELARRVSGRVLHMSRRSITLARRELDEYFAVNRRGFDVPLDWQLTRGFRREVLEATARIPYGRTASYRDMAMEAGAPGASRAAGTALATNPIPLIIPCHRVLRTGGAIGNYGGGAAAKRWLLELEEAL